MYVVCGISFLTIISFASFWHLLANAADDGELCRCYYSARSVTTSCIGSIDAPSDPDMGGHVTVLRSDARKTEV